MSGRFDGAGHYAGGHEWAPLLFMGTWLVFWVVMPLILTTALLLWRSRQPAREPLIEPLRTEPSAFELLRQQYVIGQIDVVTFEEMTEHLLISERHEASRRPPLLASYDYYQDEAPSPSHTTLL